MSDVLFSSVFEESTTLATISTSDFLLCSAVSLVLGLIIGLVYMFKNKTSSNFVVAVGLLPIIVQVVILLVNGNLGVGVAVMGVFSLVRFRSMPGTARDITTVFEAMGAGLATGMGFLGIAGLLVLLVSGATVLYAISPLGQEKEVKVKSKKKLLKIMIPEDMDYDGIFDEVLSKYGRYELQSIETASMGSLYQLKYSITLNDEGNTKAFIDELRCLNGNLKISLGLMPSNKKEL